jgi:glycosyltransferase involved in cell wall biosynthesis
MTSNEDPGAAPAPDLSVVIPSVNGLDDLTGCLHALERQVNARLEIIVVDRLGEPVRAVLRRDFPRVVVVAMASNATIPQMRAEAFLHARADSVAVIEDHVLVPPTWARQLLDALAEGADVVGGPIDNAATGTLIDWASFLCEYSACLPPLPGGESTWLPGNNIAYRRGLLERFRSVVVEGKWENRLHDAMRADGIKLICRPEILVMHKMHYTFGLYLSQRYLYARSYAGARVAEAPRTVRLAYGIAAFCLPPLLFVRTIRSIVAKRRYLRELALSLPLLCVFVTSWAVGEIAGYWFGPGDALSRVR